MNGVEFTIADPDYYLLPDQASRGAPYSPSRPPPGWERHDTGAFTHWAPVGSALPRQGWKVHVSARLDRAQQVLDVVAEVCRRHRAPFKHIRTDWLFLWLHHKHGPRMQSGKFCTSYARHTDAARSLLADLEAALAGERGPYVLTDRRYRSSTVVSYRYGSFHRRFAIQPDGTRVPTLAGPDGAEIADERQPRFVLPPGIVDPFADQEQESAQPQPAGPVTVHGYRFVSVLQFSNAGGAYRAFDPAGREVFVKEARQHNGYTWDGSTAMQRLRREHTTLRRLHAAAPGSCPEPVDYFDHWEHEFLVSELVPGVPLTIWTSQHNPLGKAGATEAAIAAYHDRCRALLASLRDLLDRLHAAGYAFVDLNPRNVLVDSADRPRLIDFEEARPLDEPRPVHGAEGFLPPGYDGEDEDLDPRHVDEYALSAIALFLLHPIHGVLDRHPASAAHVAAALPGLPADLWRAATRFRPAGATSALPGPDEVASEPEKWLDWLADRVQDGLASLCDPAAAVPYRLGPQAHATNPHCLAYGTAGVLHAMHQAGLEVPRRITGRLLDTVRADADDLPPGLFVGTAGLAWLFAELGQPDPARELLAIADRQARAGQDATLAHGTAGIALTHLALYRYDADATRLGRAADLLATVPDGDRLVPRLGPDESTGWFAGRPGIALALHYLATQTGDPEPRRRGRDLLLAELSQSRLEGGGLQFRVSRRDHRIEPYLATGSAGFALVAGRYVAGGGTDDPLATAHRNSLVSVRTLRFPILSTLFQGLAGMGLVLSDLALTTGDPALRADALRIGQALFRYAVPHGAGICFPGNLNRFSADLAHGCAGVLLFLSQLRDQRPNPLFTLEPGTPPP